MSALATVQLIVIVGALCAVSFFLGELHQMKKTIAVLENHRDWLRSLPLENEPGDAS